MKEKKIQRETGLSEEVADQDYRLLKTKYGIARTGKLSLKVEELFKLGCEKIGHLSRFFLMLSKENLPLSPHFEEDSRKKMQEHPHFQKEDLDPIENRETSAQKDAFKKLWNRFLKEDQRQMTNEARFLIENRDTGHITLAGLWLKRILYTMKADRVFHPSLEQLSQVSAPVRAHLLIQFGGFCMGLRKEREANLHEDYILLKAGSSFLPELNPPSEKEHENSVDNIYPMRKFSAVLVDLENRKIRMMEVKVHRGTDRSHASLN